MQIVITGGTGRLARELAARFAPYAAVSALDHDACDVRSRDAIMQHVARIRPDVIVNCAAYNDVDGAEANALTAMEVNGLALAYLAEAASRHRAILVHFSSDFVFDGSAQCPYSEDDIPHPLNVYGASKLWGEQLARTTERHYIIRLESVFGGQVTSTRCRPSTIERMVTALRAGTNVVAFRSRTVTPSYTGHVADAVSQTLQHCLPAGTYHCVSSDNCTWYELAVYLRDTLGSSAAVIPVESAQMRIRAPRPERCAMSTAKLAAQGIEMPPWRSALAEFLASSSVAG